MIPGWVLEKPAFVTFAYVEVAGVSCTLDNTHCRSIVIAIMPGFLVLALVLLTMPCFGQNRPNIVVILTDDQATYSLGCYGNGDVQTPHIDSLSRDGLTFDHHYATTAICMAVVTESQKYIFWPYGEEGFTPTEEFTIWPKTPWNCTTPFPMPPRNLCAPFTTAPFSIGNSRPCPIIVASNLAPSSTALYVGP